MLELEQDEGRRRFDPAGAGGGRRSSALVRKPPSVATRTATYSVEEEGAAASLLRRTDGGPDGDEDHHRAGRIPVDVPQQQVESHRRGRPTRYRLEQVGDDPEADKSQGSPGRWRPWPTRSPATAYILVATNP